MRARVVFSVVLSLWGAGTSVPVVHAAPPAASDGILASASGLLERWISAYRSRDLAAYQALYAADFHGRASKQGPPIDRADWLRQQGPKVQAVKRAQAAFPSLTVRPEDLELKLSLYLELAAGGKKENTERRLILAEREGALRIISEEILGKLPRAEIFDAAGKPQPSLSCVAGACEKLSPERQRQYVAACEEASRGSPSTRYELAQLLLGDGCGRRSPERVIQLLEPRCKEASSPADQDCSILFSALIARNAPGDVERGLRLVGCGGPLNPDAPSGDKCRQPSVVRLLLATSDERQKQAVEFLKRRCTNSALGDDLAYCEILADLAERGAAGVPKDLEAAKHYRDIVAKERERFERFKERELAKQRRESRERDY